MGYAMVGIKCLSNAYTWLYMMVASGKCVTTGFLSSFNLIIFLLQLL